MVRRDRKSGVVARRSARVGTEARGEASSARVGRGGERRLLGRLDGEDEDATTTTTSAAEEARSDHGWDVGEDASVAEEKDSSLRVVNDGHVFVDAKTCCVRRAAGDVDGDGKLEIVFAVSYYFDAHVRFDGDVDPSKYAASGLVILDGESLVTKRSVVLDRSAATGGRFKAKAYVSPTLADLNTDGRRDIIIGTYAGVLHVVDGASGEPMRGWPRKLGQVEAQVVAGRGRGRRDRTHRVRRARNDGRVQIHGSGGVGETLEE